MYVYNYSYVSAAIQLLSIKADTKSMEGGEGGGEAAEVALVSRRTG